MRKFYDFSKGTPNPYAKRLKENIHIRLDKDVLAYFKRMSEKEGIPYQTLINSFLRDCAQKKRSLNINWE